MCRLLLCALLAFSAISAAGDAPPDSTEQDRILAAMHGYADHYVENLPNFLCDQTTWQFEAGLKSDRWRSNDALVFDLRFHEGEEHRTLRLVNGKPPEQARKRWRTPLQSEGEFGILLAEVVGSGTPAYFQWSRWETVRGRRMAVFTFTVDKEHSTLRLSLSDLAHANVPYSGSIFADPQTGGVRRITNEVSDIPPALRMSALSTIVEYGEVSIGGKTYLLPLKATVSEWDRNGKIRNEIEFGNYRKFEASSSITFGAAEAPKQ